MKEQFVHYKQLAYQNRNGIFIFLGVLIFAVILYWVYSIGKKSQIGVKEEYPNNGTGIPDGWSAESVAKRFYDAMNGWGAAKPDLEAVCQELLGFTNDQVIAVYNTWQSQYYAKWYKRDILTVLTAEYCDLRIVPGGNAYTCDTRDKVIAKFNAALGAAQSKKK